MTRMRMLVVALAAICMLGLGVALSGCSDSSLPTHPEDGSLDAEVLDLPQGASIEAVENELGSPDSTAADGSTTAAHYGLWQLSYSNGLLQRKAREYRPSNPAKVFGPAFEQAVLSLRRGMPIGRVKAKLGVPMSYERIFEGSDPPTVLLRYGPWEISFEGGRLVRRTKF